MLSRCWSRSNRNSTLLTCLIWVGAAGGFSQPAIAQLAPDTAPDRNLGTRVERSSGESLIRGGAQRGENLFHSFSTFNIGNSQTVRFENPEGVNNIFSRVTGGSRSEIFGRLGVRGDANLFLINPNGILFGEGASLDVNGAFVATTANAVQLGDRGLFSATEPANSRLLSVSPSAFLFNQISPQPIQVNAGGFIGIEQDLYERRYSSGLSVPDGSSLALVGGDVTSDSGSLSAAGGRIELAGIAEPGAVGLSLDGANLRLDIPDRLTRADIFLRQSIADVRAGSGGSIVITARNLEIRGDSELRAGIVDGRGFAGAKAGDIMIDAAGAMAVVNSGIVNELGNLRRADSDLPLLGATGQGGDVAIHAGSLWLGDAFLETGTAGRGDGGNIAIRVDGEILILLNGISSNVESEAVGNGGNIQIRAERLRVRQATIVAGTSGRGNSGNILLQVNDSISTSGATIQSEPLPPATGRAGDITLQAEAGAILLNEATSISAISYGRGDAGDVVIRSPASVLIRGSFVQTSLASAPAGAPGARANGTGGDIVIQAGSLSLIDLSPFDKFRAVLRTNTEADGNAGNIHIQANGDVFLSGGVIAAVVEPPGIGRGGDITIEAASLTMDNGSFVGASTFGRGRGGDIQINLTGAMSLSGFDTDELPSELTTSASGRAIGRAGDITISSDRLYLQDRARITTETRNDSNGGNIKIDTQLLNSNHANLSATSSGTGSAGNIEITADLIQLNNRSFFRSNTSGGEGNINLQAGYLFLSGRSDITTNASGNNISGGNINVDTDLVVALENSDISANSSDFRGGQVVVNAEGVIGTEFRTVPTPESDITATGSSPDLSGTVEINTSDVDPRRGLTELPVVIVDATQQIAQTCPTGENTNQLSEFVITGRGGLPPTPGEALSNNTIQVNLATRTPGTASRSSQRTQATMNLPEPIVEAQGWVRDESGKVILLAEAPTGLSSLTWNQGANCSVSNAEE